MANKCEHVHGCFECGKPHTCWRPECIHLRGRQLLCSRCSYLYGWKQAKERKLFDDFNVSQ